MHRTSSHLRGEDLLGGESSPYPTDFFIYGPGHAIILCGAGARWHGIDKLMKAWSPCVKLYVLPEQTSAIVGRATRLEDCIMLGHDL